MRVLVVEDEMALADAVARGLRREGMAVDVAYDGDAGHEKASVTRYDVVVLDRDLPGMGGDDLCAQIVSSGATTCVLMLTAKGDSSAVYGQMDAQSKTAVTNDTLNYLLRSGYLDPKYYEQANKEAGGHTYEPPPAAALKMHYDPNGHLVTNDPPEFDFTSKAYQDWSRTYAPNAWLQTNVLGPYNNAFPNIG